jgi:hypothetical protein
VIKSILAAALGMIGIRTSILTFGMNPIGVKNLGWAAVVVGVLTDEPGRGSWCALESTFLERTR